jgi:hypothetical protein
MFLSGQSLDASVGHANGRRRYSCFSTLPISLRLPLLADCPEAVSGTTRRRTRPMKVCASNRALLLAGSTSLTQRV